MAMFMAWRSLMFFQGELASVWLNTPASTVLASFDWICALPIPSNALASAGVSMVTMSSFLSPAATAFRASAFEMMLSNTRRTAGLRSGFQ